MMRTSTCQSNVLSRPCAVGALQHHDESNRFRVKCDHTNIEMVIGGGARVIGGVGTASANLYAKSIHKQERHALVDAHRRRGERERRGERLRLLQ